MMIKKQHFIPAVLLGFALLGGSTAYAFGGGIPLGAFKGFTAEKQAAIQKAEDIRQNAEKEAKATLDAAGVTREEMHTAMMAYHTEHMKAMDAALEAKDFDAFKALMKDMPMADSLTQDAFNTLVEIHALEKKGDREGAQKLRESLKDSGFAPHMGMEMGRHGQMHDGGKADGQ